MSDEEYKDFLQKLSEVETCAPLAILLTESPFCDKYDYHYIIIYIIIKIIFELCYVFFIIIFLTHISIFFYHFKFADISIPEIRT